MAANSTSTSAAKVDTVTLRHLAETLSEAHELPKKQVMSMLEDMVTTVTKHLKRGARIRIGGLGILQVRKRPARMAAIPRPESRSRSRRARRSPSAPPRTSRKRSSLRGVGWIERSVDPSLKSVRDDFAGPAPGSFTEAGPPFIRILTSRANAPPAA